MTKIPIEVHCIACPLVFCCAECRRAHERLVHNLLYECPICRYEKFACSSENLNNEQLIKHLVEEHLPLHCGKCERIFSQSSDFENIDLCHTIPVNNNNQAVIHKSEIDDCEENENEVTNNIANEEKELEDRFNSLYEKCFDIPKGSNENFEAIVSINKSSKTAVITPILKYTAKANTTPDEKDNGQIYTPHPNKEEKKLRRTNTPHVRKYLTRQIARDESEKNDENFQSHEKENSEFSGIQLLQQSNNSSTPRSVEPDEHGEENHTPTSHTLKVDMCTALASAVTTSTPTNPASQWTLFPEPGADSPISEIEGTGDSPMESPQGATDAENSKESTKKLKSIIVINGKPRFGSQDSSEKQVTFAETVSSDASSLGKTKKVKFAQDTKFEDNKLKRVFRRPKRLLTPGPQSRTRKITNPHFQALLNRFETHQTVSRTPDTCRDEQHTETTPALSDVQVIPARAINFKEDSPTIEESIDEKPAITPETPNEAFKSCVEYPAEIKDLQQDAIDTFANNVASSIQTCLSSALQTNDDAMEIQFKFVVTKKRVSVRRIVNGENFSNEKENQFERQPDRYEDNIWRTIAKVVKNVFWSRSDEKDKFVETPLFSNKQVTIEHSSGSKRKSDDLVDSDTSPVNHKRYKYGRPRGRRPLPRVLRQQAMKQAEGSKNSEENTTE